MSNQTEEKYKILLLDASYIVFVNIMNIFNFMLEKFRLQRNLKLKLKLTIMNNFSYDPYEILQVDPNATLPEIKQAYLYVARMYHPDKGGDTHTFQFIQKAYKDIIKSRKGEATQSQQHGYQIGGFHDLKQGFQNYDTNYAQPETIMGTNQVNSDFDNNIFNNKFRERYAQRSTQSESNEPDYTFDISELDYTERTKADFERENARINDTLSATSRIFNQGAFDPNSFNRMFNWAKEHHQAGIQDLEEYVEPEAAIQGSEGIAFSEIADARNTKNLSSLGYSDYQQVFNKSHKNPDNIDKKLLDKFARQRDITQEEALSQQKIRQRMAAYQGAEINIEKGGHVDFSKPIPEGQLYTGFRNQSRGQQMPPPSQLINTNQPPGIAPRPHQMSVQMPPLMAHMQQRMPPQQMPPHQMPPHQMMPPQMPPHQMPPQMLPHQMPPHQMPPHQMMPPQMPPHQMPPHQMPPQRQIPSQQLTQMYSQIPMHLHHPPQSPQSMAQNFNGMQQGFNTGQIHEQRKIDENPEIALMQRIQERNQPFTSESVNPNLDQSNHYYDIPQNPYQNQYQTTQLQPMQPHEPPHLYHNMYQHDYSNQYPQLQQQQPQQYYQEPQQPLQPHPQIQLQPQQYYQPPRQSQQYDDLDNQIVLYNPDNQLEYYPNDQMNTLKDQMEEMQKTIEVQHKLLKKLANKKGYRV